MFQPEPMASYDPSHVSTQHRNVWFSNRRAKRNKEKNLRNKSLFGTMDSSLSNKELTSTEGSVTGSNI
ncbi:hypothetical protein CRE_08418 [Caenorhabditis remanei]|uniref:Homeobox domain-containing protein n=1 Tax=Caenorhabditis remanei TaxID=31234 RepID=E3MPM4_CAERE|nr:hypothetical protein CRE_08418 [Caenorhabditis remanei]